MGTQELWIDIVSWLEINASMTARAILTPAPEPLIRSLEQAVPNGWPTDLSTLYRLFDGTEPSTAGYILDIWTQVGADMDEEFERQQRSPLHLNLRALGEAHGRVPAPEPHKPYDPAKAEADEAGTRAWMFISPFLPIADNNAGDYLFVDLRSGRQHGCVSEYFKDEADWRPAIWPSTEVLLRETLTSLRTGQPVFSSRPVVTDGSLHWEFQLP